MWFIQKFIVRKHERGLLFKDGDFIKFLAPGSYRYFGLRHCRAVERYDISVAAFEHRLADYLVEAERTEIDRLFHVVETNADEVALVYLNERAAAVCVCQSRASPRSQGSLIKIETRSIINPRL